VESDGNFTTPTPDLGDTGVAAEFGPGFGSGVGTGPGAGVGGIGDVGVGDPTNQNPNSIGDETYQVVVSIEDLAVLNEGISYSDGDTIQITPDNGAIIEPIINDFGNIVDVNVISGGTGFVDIPEIRVISNTGNGINAVLVPIFKFTRISDTDQLFDIPLNTPVMNVIDCVGKFPGI
jgi:hypothetical protein